ncbi:MAG: type II toxin-antitoxin system HicB family antitoxin [Ignavibacteriae bacterium]|jgi:predicted RNase H-like HicB family nuclease|nr:type II toxin-antitoxin system HicB family antitoxin [Ignavibacteriota bacterium]
MKYAIIIEKGGNNFSAYVPDLPGCVSTGKTVKETKTNIQEAIQFHIQGLLEDGELIPKPVSISDTVEVAA